VDQSIREKQKNKRDNMSKINEGLDPNNPSHSIVIEINNRNEAIYGPYNEKYKLFQAFVPKPKPYMVSAEHVEWVGKMIEFGISEMEKGGGKAPDSVYGVLNGLKDAAWV
jgi:hypothetical protein